MAMQKTQSRQQRPKNMAQTVAERRLTALFMAMGWEYLSRHFLPAVVLEIQTSFSWVQN
jgi:hypothetical protein